MTTRAIRTEADLAALIALIRARTLPFTVSIAKGVKRTSPQNKLQRKWCEEAAAQLGDRTAEDVRAHCKLHHGVPILRAEHAEFCVAYDKHIRPLPYETKLAMMAEPLDWPVTRLMTTGQKTRYLDAMRAELVGMGIRLTDPEMAKWEDE